MYDTNFNRRCPAFPYYFISTAGIHNLPFLFILKKIIVLSGAYCIVAARLVYFKTQYYYLLGTALGGIVDSEWSKT